MGKINKLPVIPPRALDAGSANPQRIMNITAFRVNATCPHTGAGAHSQKITLDACNTGLKKIFDDIQKQTGYSFVYTYQIIQKTKPVDPQVSNMSLKEALDTCFKDQPLTYKVVDNTVFVSSSVNDPTADDPSPVDIKGRITYDKGKPVAGASVSAKGTKKLTTTNENGEFFLLRVEQNAVLVISHPNIITMEI